MHLDIHKVVQGAVHVHHDPHVQGQAHREVKEGFEAHHIDQYTQEVVLDALRSAYEVGLVAVHVHHDPLVPLVQGLVHL
jgi:hypothetical protein